MSSWRSGPARRCWVWGGGADGRDSRLWVASLRRSRPDAEQMAEGLAELYVRGVEVDWAGYHRGRGGRLTADLSVPAAAILVRGGARGAVA